MAGIALSTFPGAHHPVSYTHLDVYKRQGELNHYPLIRHIASFGKPMLVSTGMNDLSSIAKTVDILEGSGVPYALLHTTNLYPTPPNLVRLGAMEAVSYTHLPKAIITRFVY